MKKNSLLLLAIALAASSSAFAANNEIYATVGSTGLAGGYAYGVNDHFATRAEYAGFSYDGTYDNSGTHYDGRLKLQSAGVYADYFPMGGSFRVTGGFVSNSFKFSGTADGNSGTVTINHVKYPLAGETAKATITYPSCMPYLGIGFGHNAAALPGWHVVADLGLMFGNPTTHIALSPGLAAQVPASDIRAQEHQINDDVKVAYGWPVASVGVGFTF